MIHLQLLIACIVLLSSQVAFATTCNITIPNAPLTAAGLSQVFVLSGCTMSDPGQQVFVEASIYDPFTNKVFVYPPLVADNPTKIFQKPVFPQIPDGAVVALWFGTNADNLILNGDLAGGNCVNGLKVNGKLSQFGQFAYCNAPEFFLNAASVDIPALGTASDGQPCLTTRDFALVDQDQSDNVVTSYLLDANGRTAQNTQANTNKNPNAQVITNGSDNLLLKLLDDIMGCQPFKAQSLAEPNFPIFVPSLALNELAAARQQAEPVARIPASDPMVLVDNNPNIAKLNLYRVGVNQAVGAPSSDLEYCKNFANIAPARFLANKDLFLKSQTADPGVGDTMFTFLAGRFVKSFGPDGLNCLALGLTSPISVSPPTGPATNAVITLNNNGANQNVVLGGAIGGGAGGLLLLGGAFLALRRRSRRSLDRTPMKMESRNPGFTGYQQNNIGSGFAATFNNFRQSLMPSQWGQNIRKSMMNLGGFGGGASAPYDPNNNGPWGGNKAATSPMSSAPTPPPIRAPPSQFGSPPNSFGNPPPPYGKPASPFGGNQNQYGGGASQWGQQPAFQAPQPYGGGYGRGYQ